MLSQSRVVDSARAPLETDAPTSAPRNPVAPWWVRGGSIAGGSVGGRSARGAWHAAWLGLTLGVSAPGCTGEGSGDPTVLEAKAHAAARYPRADLTSRERQRPEAPAAAPPYHRLQSRTAPPTALASQAPSGDAPEHDPLASRPSPGPQVSAEDSGDDGCRDEEDAQENEGSCDATDPDEADDCEDPALDNEEPDELEGARSLSDLEVERGAQEQGIHTAPQDRFFDMVDGPLRARMATLSLAKVKRGRGGRSLGFKVTLEDGTKGYFKAEQTFSAANWNSEIAAYHLDRMLGFHRVPATVSRKIPWDQLERAARGDSRRREIIVRKDGGVRGALLWWIPGGLRTWPDLPGWEKWIRVRGWPRTTVTPLQRPAVWAHRLKLRRQKGDDWMPKHERRRRRHFDSRPDRPDRAAELSDLIVFDYLTKNIDRWGGRNANVLIRGRAGALVFLDNGAGFAPGLARPSLMESRLHVLQRFRRSTVRAVKSLDIGELKRRLDTEPLAPILPTRQLRHLKERRDALLEWIRRMEKRYGKRAFPWE